MRELKFREWCSEGGKKSWMNFFDISKVNICDNGPIMQYTGFKDRNGVEIYEGDVLRRWVNSRGKVYPSNFEGNRITVTFTNGSYNIKPKLLDRLEIVGNVYQGIPDVI